MTIPSQVQFIITELQKRGFEAYIVGGCVRDILLARHNLGEGGRKVNPQDWDITTNAKPEQIRKIFPQSFSNNEFGTVTVLSQISNLKSQICNSKVKSEKNEKQEYMEVEVTPFRIEEKYTDKRHPDKVKWAKTIEQDLGRRDFTVNAMAIALKERNRQIQNSKQSINYRIIDLFNGQEDLKNKIIRTVNNPDDRFNEDALRMMRAVRFAVCLETNSQGQSSLWKIEPETFQSLQKNAHLLQFISKERIRDELIKIINSKNGAQGIEILRKTGLLKYIIPELEQGFNIEQNKHHIYQIYQHSLLSLNYACEKNFSIPVKFASLLHDIAKPITKKGQGLNSTFYNHEIIGAKMTCQILKRLKFSKKDIEKIVKLVRYHLFYYNVGEVGDSSVRRLLRKVGKENIVELLQVRYSDRIGSSAPKAEPYKLRHLKYLFEKVSKDPISPKMLKISGTDVMKILNIPQGPKVGQVLACLLEQVLSDPKKNTQASLEKEVEKLAKLSDKEIEKLNKKAQKQIEEITIKKDKMTKNKYWVT